MNTVSYTWNDVNGKKKRRKLKTLTRSKRKNKYEGQVDKITTYLLFLKPNKKNSSD